MGEKRDDQYNNKYQLDHIIVNTRMLLHKAFRLSMAIVVLAFLSRNTAGAGHEHHSMHSNSENRNDDSSSATFCAGMPMTMFMDGFHWSLKLKGNSVDEEGRPLQSSEEQQQCLNYLFNSWLLASPKQFRGAMVFSFLLAIVMEAISAFREWILRTQAPSNSFRKITLVLIYALQSLLGYVIMIVAMMYSLELLFSVAAGLAVGHLLFVRILPVPGLAAVNRQHND
jgi:hypothetical protein